MLHGHVLDLHRQELAVLAAVFQGLLRGEGVDVDLHDAALMDRHDGVAQRFQRLCESVQVKGGKVCLGIHQLQDKLGAVAVFQHAVGTEITGHHSGGGDGIVDAGGVLNGFAPQAGQHTLDKAHEAGAAAVHHTGFLQNRQQLRGAGQGALQLGQQILKTAHQVVEFVAVIFQILSAFPDEGQNGALGGGHDGLVGILGGAAESRREILEADGVLALKATGHAVDELGEDDTGIAAGRQQDRPGEPLHIVANTAQVLGHSVQAAAEGVHHIGAGVAVGNGEHIQVVDGVAVLFQITVAAHIHGVQSGAVQSRLIHDYSLPSIITSVP